MPSEGLSPLLCFSCILVIICFLLFFIEVVSMFINFDDFSVHSHWMVADCCVFKQNPIFSTGQSVYAIAASSVCLRWQFLCHMWKEEKFQPSQKNFCDPLLYVKNRCFFRLAWKFLSFVEASSACRKVRKQHLKYHEQNRTYLNQLLCSVVLYIQ